MNRNYRLVIELDADLADSEWTEEELLENAAHYLVMIISRAEAANAGEGESPYSLDVDDLTVWTQGGYAEDHCADLHEGDSL